MGWALLCLLGCQQVGVGAATPVVVSATATAPISSEQSGSVVRAGTLVHISVDQMVSSKTDQIGASFAIRLAEPIVENDHPIVAAGLLGRGEIIHAAKAGWGGRAGELILAARYLECGSTQIPLGRMKLGGSGSNNAGGALAAGVVVPFAEFLVRGGDIKIPPGTLATAIVKADTTLPSTGNVTTCVVH